METIRGKTSHNLDLDVFCEQLKNYSRVLLDLGTGDGRYVRFLADRNPHCFIIGVDSCRENLREHSRLTRSNALFVIASAQELPREFNGLISQITINFPWGSLLKSLVKGDETLMNGLASIAKQSAQIDILLNSGALLEAGADLDAGARRIYENLNQHGWNLKRPIPLSDRELCSIPTTWAKRLAYGRDPRAIALSGRFAK
jgi:16S rRNA (adenine(1408)-N(1))-methyltransferase